MWRLRILCIALLGFPCFATYALTPSSNLRVVLTGIKGDAEKNILVRLSNKQTQQGQALSAQAVHNFYRQAPQEIRKALEPFGYFNPRIGSILLRKGSHWTAYFTVSPGIPVRIENIEIKITGPGANNNAICEALSHLPIHKDAIFNVPQYNNAKQMLFTNAKGQGYLKAHLDNKIMINKRAHTAKIHIHLETSHRYYFGHFIFKTHPYADYFLRRFFHICPGEVFSTKRLVQTQQALEGSYYFKRVVFKPEINQAQDYRIPIDTDLFAPKPVQYMFGAGYGTLTGVRVNAGLSLRHLTDTGEHFEGRLKLSSVLGVISGNYYIPGADPLTDAWLIGANYKKFNPKHGKSNSGTLTGGYSTRFGAFRLSSSLNFLYERFYALPPPISRFTHQLYAKGEVSYLNTDNLFTPHQGIYLSLTMLGAGKPLFSTVSFGQATLRGKVIVSPLRFCRMIARGVLGYTGLKHLYRFPLSLRYFAGGIDSIRGFPELSIGPGKYLDIGSLEYQQLIWNHWYLAVFYDVGSAANHVYHPINRGAGIGIVYNSIVGPMKLYGARALSKRGMPHSIEFSIGPEFS